MLEQIEQVVPRESQEYIPLKEEALREYEIKIRFLSRGCIVSVGCKEIPFETIDTAMTELNAYVSEPWKMQKKWREILK
jgi:hypothetical protein